MRIARNPSTPTSLAYDENMAVFYSFDNQWVIKRALFLALEKAPKQPVFHAFLPRVTRLLAPSNTASCSEQTYLLLRASPLDAPSTPFSPLFRTYCSSISPTSEVLNFSNFLLHLFVTSFFPFNIYSNSSKKIPPKIFHLSFFFPIFAAQNIYY